MNVKVQMTPLFMQFKHEIRSTYEGIESGRNNQIRTMIRERDMQEFVRWMHNEDYRPVWIDVFEDVKRDTWRRKQDQNLYFNVILTKNLSPLKELVYRVHAAISYDCF